MAPRTIAVWVAYAWLRHLRNRSSRGRAYDLPVAVDPFALRQLEPEEAPLIGTIMVASAEQEIRRFEGRLFQRTLSADREAVSTDWFGRQAANQLVDDAEETFEWGHPGAIDRSSVLQDEPLGMARPSDVEKPRFWTVENDPGKARARLTTLLEGCFVIGDGLWRPVDPPTLWVSARSGNVQLRLGGTPRAIDSGIGLNWSERHLVANALAARGLNADDSATYRYAMGLDLEHQANGGDADMRMLEQTLKAMARVGSTWMAASGPRVMAAFWSGREIVADGGNAEAVDWHARHSEALASSAIPPIVRAARLFDERRRLLR